MKKLFTLTAEEVNALQGVRVYCVNLTNKDGARLFAMSQGATAEALGALAGSYVFMKHDRESGRLIPLMQQLTKAETRALCNLSFNTDALSRACLCDSVAISTASAYCTKCGKSIDSRRIKEHKCGERLCALCGSFITSAEEIHHRFCARCAFEKYARLYGYHRRPRESSPLFEKPDNRIGEPHLGFEIEFGGSENFERTNASAHALAEIMNTDGAFVPFCEFETDASLEDGMECILRPMTLRGLEKRRERLDAFYAKTKNLGGKYGRVNGLHCHIDRDFFGERGTDERAKGAILIEAMIYKFFDFFALISRRASGCFSYAQKKDRVKGIATAFIYAREQEHSYAVNGSGSNTVELRIFGGAIDNANDLLAVADIARAVAFWAKKSTLTQAEKATPCALIPYIRDAGRVLAFVENLNERAPHTASADAMLEEFKKALNEKIQKGAM